MKWMALACIIILLAAGLGEKTLHFSVKYSDAQAFAPGTGRALEDAYRSVNQWFGNLPEKIKVIVIDGEKMDDVGKHVEAFSAWSNRSSTIVLRDETLKDHKSLSVVARHEICHLALNDILSRKPGDEFAWMEEGVCMVISGEPLDDVKVSRYIVSEGFMSLLEIARAIDSDSYSVCKNGYLQSYSLCKRIAGKYSTQTLVDILRSPASSFEAAFEDHTGADFQAFCDEWKAEVKSAAKGQPAPCGVPIRGYLDLGDVAA